MREDYNLGFILQYENVAWFDEECGEVRILDRRIYPAKTEFCICKTYVEVAKAISDMVTQSGGPFAAAGMGMALAAYQGKNLSKVEYLNFMKDAAYALSHVRPTTSKAMQLITGESLNLFEILIKDGTSSSDIIKALKQNAVEQNNVRYKKNTTAGSFFADLVPDGSSILTQCFGETTVGGYLRKFNETRKRIKVFCAETRPYFQGARLTASLVYDMGFDTTVITDNMIALLMSEKKINFCVSASDVITLDGSIINKIGTLQIAIAANYFGIPYYAIGFPDKNYASAKEVKIEYRNPEEALYAMGKRTAILSDDFRYDCKSENKSGSISGLYPAFDITPFSLCTGIITDKGFFKPIVSPIV
ncbi:s-methyl-5-thioribose-1-phosphate isomerase [Treponema putidum]|uniref:S-methyl-5-thioribose-1-phosphate isomerase n=1 Tax=Treponema putidum TaxID=221027 RepID=A0AAE9MUB2_9SPIR|nr:s-methyl-5-thioribose-1-phosphate isomerase [Treponema putidum]AIN94527.1 methylthioribose-1-phosphate isomerase [Treponema putidum]TWI78877.1 methylthioribose-1-phosphate isomerase [Treponema putidum]UTY28530.1 s-methyl-5-thioribose-1-phosphate isomerase [Treponema putidum]UTY30977.1 s-methyl-5-thioribose-1-phosphate isomerase [Treponema putidum]UTY33398.1 s-methyl-5-thioribose-1-phosphate isomerase [Treponema putidum]